MYALASAGHRRSAGSICVLCAALAGVGCTPWRLLGTGALPVAFACCVRRLLLAQGSDVRPGVGWAPSICVLCAALAACQGVGCMASAGHRRFAGGVCVDVRPGVGWAPALCRLHLRAVCGACCLPRGRMYALASAGHRRSAGSICVLCAALAACPGVGCTPWRRLGAGALPVEFACCVLRLLLPRGRMYALASAGHPRSAGSICVLCAALAACQGVGCTPWRRLGTGALPVAFACCVRRLLLAKGSDVRPGVGWAPALCR